MKKSVVVIGIFAFVVLLLGWLYFSFSLNQKKAMATISLIKTKRKVMP